jgi:hypothetical protein
VTAPSKDRRRVELQRAAKPWLVTKAFDLSGQAMPRTVLSTWSLHDLRVYILNCEYPPVEAK